MKLEVIHAIQVNVPRLFSLANSGFDYDEVAERGREWGWKIVDDSRASGLAW